MAFITLSIFKFLILCKIEQVYCLQWEIFKYSCFMFYIKFRFNDHRVKTLFFL